MKYAKILITIGFILSMAVYASADNATQDCAICYEEVAAQEAVTYDFFPCTHPDPLHANCLAHYFYLQKKTTCPVCRAPLHPIFKIPETILGGMTKAFNQNNVRDLRLFTTLAVAETSLEVARNWYLALLKEQAGPYLELSAELFAHKEIVQEFENLLDFHQNQPLPEEEEDEPLIIDDPAAARKKELIDWAMILFTAFLCVYC